jgi:hypothetical protein
MELKSASPPNIHDPFFSSVAWPRTKRGYTIKPKKKNPAAKHFIFIIDRLSLQIPPSQTAA